MALDRSMVLRSGLPGIPVAELIRLVARELERCGPVNRLRSGTRAGAGPADAVVRPLRPGGEAFRNLALYVPGRALEFTPDIVSQLTSRARSPYAVLDSHVLQSVFHD
jgi:hypothetical protein